MAPKPQDLPSSVTWRMLPEGEPEAIEDIRDALIIRENELFLLTDCDGGVPLNSASGFGLYHHDTRYLSGWDFSLIDVEPVILLSTAEMGFGQEQVMSNPELIDSEGRRLGSGSLEIRRERVLDGSLVETVRLTNFALTPLTLSLRYRFDADFSDIFEIRGLRRKRRGRRLPPRVHPEGVTFSYAGLDGISRRTSIHFAPHPNAVDAGQAIFHIEVAPRQSVDIQATVSLDQMVGRGTARRSTQSVADRYQQWKEGSTQVITSHELFNTILDRSLTDLRMLWTNDQDNPYLAAGTPWFDTLFGRDAALTALQTLAIQPEIAGQALRSLAAYQGSQLDPEREEQPGKIHHELRRGEMANCGEVPYARYYGSIDSTPLFLLLASEYYRWTADLELMRALEPALRDAIQWIDQYGDPDGDGFLEYKRRSKRGLDNQGWKDSFDSMTHADGTLLKPPIAVVEVQGYVYAAKKGLARIFSDLGDHSQAERLWADAERLRRPINRDFWLEEGYYAMALDARKSPAKVMSSNAGQMLWTGVPWRHQARSLAERLMRNDMFSGWGIRTLSSNARRYNPMGYHVGTVWPHDNALVAAGLKRYGFESELNEIATGLFDACCAFPYFRLPELFGGDPRSGHRSPVPYPVACRPLAMAAAAMPHILTSILGLCPDATRQRLQVVRPRLPYWLEFVRLTGLRIGDGQVDLLFQRRGKRTFVDVLASRGPVEVVVLRQWPKDQAPNMSS